MTAAAFNKLKEERPVVRIIRHLKLAAVLKFISQHPVARCHFVLVLRAMPNWKSRLCSRQLHRFHKPVHSSALIFQLSF